MDKINLLSVAAAAKILSMTESRIRYEVFHKTIPYIKIGRSIRFSEADLIEWILSKKKRASDER